MYICFMDIIVNRQKSSKDWTLSTFESICKTVKGVGVEDEFRAVKVHGETRIPKGQYDITLTHSPKFSKEYYRDEHGYLILTKDWNVASPEIKRQYAWPHELILINNIPNFSRVLIHWGNTDLDTEGCYIVGSVFGKTKGRDGVLNSRKKYTQIYPLIFRAIKKGKSTIKFIDNE